MKKIILISVDHKWRDLEGNVYSKILLEKKGYKVILIRNGFEEYYADVLNPIAIILIHLYDKKKSALIKRLKQRGILIFLMPTEGIPTMTGTRKLAAGYFSDLSDVDIHFVWNDEMKKIMLENKTIAESKINVTGVPRFDFYRPPLSELLITKSIFFKKYKRKINNYPIITWATNFTHAGFYKKNKDFFKKDWANFKLDKIYNTDDVAFNEYKAREITFENIKKLLTEIKNINLIIKPHPSEEQLYFFEKKKELEKLINGEIFIITKEYIWDVLNVTDILLKRSCTTGIEAWILEKPTVELRFYKKQWLYSKDHAAGSIEVDNYEKLKQIVEYYLNGGAIKENLETYRKEFLKKWCYKTDGNSTKRFIEKVNEYIQGNRTEIKKQNNLLKYIKSFLIYYLMEITNFKIHNLKVYGLWGRKDKLGRIDKYFDRKDELFYYKKIKKIIN